MIEAVNEWFNDGPVLDSAQQKISMTTFAKMKGLPATTFKYYAHKDLKKRRKLGVCGRKPLVLNQISDVLCEVSIRYDQANLGLTPAQLEDKCNWLPRICRLSRYRIIGHGPFATNTNTGSNLKL